MSQPIQEPEVSVRPDRFALWSCILALFIMVLPLEADMLVALVRHDIHEAGVFALICFLIVAVPFAYSLWRRLRQPFRWEGRGYLITTGIVLGLNLLMVVSMFHHQLSR